MLRAGCHCEETAEFYGKEDWKMAGTHTVQIVAGLLAAAVLGIIVYRRKQKAA